MQIIVNPDKDYNHYYQERKPFLSRIFRFLNMIFQIFHHDFRVMDFAVEKRESMKQQNQSTILRKLIRKAFKSGYTNLFAHTYRGWESNDQVYSGVQIVNAYVWPDIIRREVINLYCLEAEGIKGISIQKHKLSSNIIPIADI